jgi:ATP-dependent helicase/nuclease subunit B
MKLTVGWGLSGPAFVDESGATARVGQPTWGPSELLRDLELRLGLPGEGDAESVRVPKYRARVAHLADAGAFYARSFEVDPIGTARALLAFRDALVEAGWDGTLVANGGVRLAALAAIEAALAEPLPRTLPDRLVCVEAALRARAARAPLYREIALVEERALWPTRWQSIFALLEACGTRLARVYASLPGAPAGTDLGVLQRLLRGEVSGPVDVKGDGSLVLLRGETPDEVAEASAALLRSYKEGTLVIRSLPAAPLEAALVQQALPGQGYVGKSAWRPAMQVLSLALELAFEPRDPRRVLELLTLPVGPFRGRVGAQLARAVAKQPGVGGQEWQRRKALLAEALRDEEATRRRAAGEDDVEAASERHAAERLRRVEEWFETNGAGPEGAERSALITLGRRVCDWLERRLRNGELDVYGAAHARAKHFVEALVHDTWDVLSRAAARQLLEDIAWSEQGHALTLERTGRIPHVAHPSAILASARTVVFWGFVSTVEQRPQVLPWNRAERTALAAAGMRFSDQAGQIACEANAWRRAVLAARERVLFVVPNRAAGRPMSPHSLWHEIAARLDLDEEAAAKLTRSARSLLHEGAEAALAVEELVPRALPVARVAWSLSGAPFSETSESEAASATALEKLAGCPLAWVLKRAGVQLGMIAKIPEGPLLNGGLGHRLVEALFRDGAFAGKEPAFLARAEALLSELVRTEAATLLLPGAASERAQLEAQLHRGVRALYRYLAESGFRIAAVEEAVEIDSVIGKVSARLDLRLSDGQGNPAVLDLKWGAGSYTKKVEQGLAVQLAAYSRALRAGYEGAAMPPAAYFSLGSGRVLSADPRMSPPKLLQGPSLEETWARLERTLRAVRTRLAEGQVLVGGTESAPRLLHALEISEAEQAKYLAIAKADTCEYCAYAGLCGKAWEAFQ